MKHLYSYKVFEKNIDAIEFPEYGDKLSEREISIIEARLGKSILTKILRKIEIRKEDGYYYVRTVVKLYDGIVEQISHMRYDSFNELLEFLTFKKYMYSGDLKKVTNLINSKKTTIDLSFDSGRLFYWIVDRSFSIYHIKYDSIESIKIISRYKFEDNMVRRCIEKMMHFSRHMGPENLDIIVDLVKYIVDNTDEFHQFTFSDFIRISIESELDFRFIKCFVESKHFKPHLVSHMHKILPLCVYKKDLKSMELLLNNGVRDGIREALSAILNGSKDETHIKMIDLLGKFISKREN